MKRYLVLVTALAVSFGLFAAEASAQGLLGKRHIKLTVGQIVPGDDVTRDFDDAVMTIGASVNYPVHANLDAFAVLGYDQSKGSYLEEVASTEITTKSIEAGATYHFYPGESFDPFVRGSLGWGQTEANRENPGFSKDGTENDFVLSVGGGIEVPFANQFAARPAVKYRQLGDTDDFFGSIDVNGWFNEVLFVGLGVSYGIDAGDFAYNGSVGFGF